MDLLGFHRVLIFSEAFFIVLLAVMLCMIRIPKDKELFGFAQARKYLAYSYSVLGIVGLINFLFQKDESDNSLSSVLILAIASYQALFLPIRC